MTDMISADLLRPELWLPVPEFEDVYEVSNHGRVRNIATGHVLRAAKNRGYHHVALCRGGEHRTTYIHVLVLRAFCGAPPFAGAYACHNDGNPGNNHLTNLRWGTAKDNARDRARHGNQPFGTGVRRAKLNEQAVRDMREAYRNGKSTWALAKELGLSTHTTWCAVTGKTWKHVEGAVNNAG